MVRNDVYIDVYDRKISLFHLDREERGLVSELQRRAKSYHWNEFEYFWMKTVGDFYDARGLTRKQSRQTAVYQIGQDLCSRIGLAEGLMRLPDYRDELDELIRTRFKTRRAFCKATGISEDMLSHVLSGRKDLSLSKLTGALDRIGYTLHIIPAPRKKLTG